MTPTIPATVRGRHTEEYCGEQESEVDNELDTGEREDEENRSRKSNEDLGGIELVILSTKYNLFCPTLINKIPRNWFGSHFHTQVHEYLATQNL